MRGADYNDRLVGAASDGGNIALARLDARRYRDAALELAAQTEALATLLAAEPAAWIALAPPADAELPGELLRRLRAAGIAVQGFVDRAALLAAWLPDCLALAVLDMSLRQFSIGLAVREGDMAALRRHVPLPGGARALHDAWLRLAASTLVQQTRFDPLHDVRHESALRERIPALAAGAQRDGQASCEVATANGAALLTLTRDQFAAASRPVLAPLADALQALSAAHGEATLLVPSSVLEIPGIDTVLSGAHFARICSGADGLAARPASQLAPSGVVTEGGVPYRTSLPLFATPAPTDVLESVAIGTHDARAMATHVVWRGKVVPIPASGLVIGRDPGPAPSLRLPEGLAGLSRRHCTLRRDGARAQIIDHSSHGTFLDGARVRGRALLPAGGTLRLGDPGIELPLVAIETE